MTEKQSVLVVDDELKNQRIISEILGDQATLQAASTGEEALKILKSHSPDLVLLDIMMPGIDGYEVCRRIRANPRLSLTKIILVSGKAMLEERLKGYEAGADDYMTKPFAPEELLAKAKVFLRLTLIERQHGELLNILDETVQDRTRQLVETKAKLISSAKMSALGEMASCIAHEINTPLATIAMIVEQVQELVNEKKVDRKAVAEMTQMVGETVQRISAIINGLRTLSRDGSQDGFEAISLKQIIDNTLSLCNERLRHAHIEIRVEPIAKDLRIQCRSAQISQVLLNLIGNAIDAVLPLPDKWIAISAETFGSIIEIRVTDSGAGIPEALRAKLFQPFFTTKDKDRGSGLGLSISKGIIDVHGGTLEIDSSCKNTRFVFRLPAAKKAA